MADTDLDRIPKWWPVIAAFIVVIVAGVRVQAAVETQAGRLDRVEITAAESRDRLARIDERTAYTLEIVRRMDAKLAADSQPRP